MYLLGIIHNFTGCNHSVASEKDSTNTVFVEFFKNLRNSCFVTNLPNSSGKRLLLEKDECKFTEANGTNSVVR